MEALRNFAEMANPLTLETFKLVYNEHSVILDYRDLKHLSPKHEKYFMHKAVTFSVCQTHLHRTTVKMTNL